MSAVALIIVGTIVLAVLLGTLVPGAGFIGVITVVVIGLTAVVWLLSAGASKQAPVMSRETPRIKSSSDPAARRTDALHARGFKPETCAMDKGYDNNRVYAECEERGVEPVIPLRGAKGSSQPCR